MYTKAPKCLYPPPPWKKVEVRIGERAGKWTIWFRLNLSVSGPYRAEFLKYCTESSQLYSLYWFAIPNHTHGCPCACPHSIPDYHFLPARGIQKLWSVGVCVVKVFSHVFQCLLTSGALCQLSEYAGCQGCGPLVLFVGGIYL